MKKVLLLVTSLFISILSIAVPPKDTLQLRSGTPVQILLSQSLESSEEISNPRAIIAVDVLDRKTNKEIIEAGTPVQIEVTSTKAKGIGKNGSIIISIISTTAVDGQRIILSGSHTAKGEDRQTMAWIATGAGCLILGPFGFLGLLIKGENAEIPKSTSISAQVAQSYSVKEE